MSDLPPIAKQFRVKAVGVTFSDDYPENLTRLTRLAPAVERAANVGKLLGARLVRDPENPHDANAVRVVVPEVGHIGHLPRDLAAKLPPAWMRPSSGVVRSAPSSSTRTTPTGPASTC